MRTFMLLFLSAFCAFGQVDSGAITGVITDATGAIVPGVKVDVVQVETNTITSLSTNSAGFYSAPSLRPGIYLVSVSKTGFSPQRSQPFDLRVQDRAEIDFTLQLGTTTSEITVSATAPLLESETSSVGQVVEQKTIADLPLNGRNLMSLAVIGAGASPAQRTSERDAFIANGARGVQNSYILDGIDNRNRIVGFDKSSAQIIHPVIDAIQEFKVQTSTFSAEFGQAAGGVVNVTMKSGTNQIHGNLFEFLRNSDLDATPYFQPAGTAKPQFIQNQFGATVGGPIIKNRTFFFGSWQTSRESNAAAQLGGGVPTLAERQGIFPSTVKDPTTKATFPNNTVPLSTWDPISAKLIALYPLPNLPGAVNNFYYNPKERITSNDYNVKIDHHFGTRDYLFGRISQAWGDEILPAALPEPANQAIYVNLYPRQVMASETHTFTPNLVNEVRLAQVYTRNIQDTNGPRLTEQYGIKGTLDDPRIKGLPQFSPSGFTALGTSGPGSLTLPATGSGNAPSDKSGKIWQLLDSLAWVHGRHTIKTGIDFQRVTEFAYATNSARPNFAFSGAYTGNGLADFMLGWINNTATSQQQVDTVQTMAYNAYVQDDWKVSKRLTLNLGIRYEVSTPWTEEFNRESNFVLDSGPCYAQLVTATDAGRCGVGRALYRGDYNNFAPRLGLALQASPKTVVRGGFGVFYGRDENIGVARRLTNNPPLITTSTFVGTQTTPAFLLKDGFPSNALSLATGGTTVNNWPFNFHLPYVLQWSLNVERELPGNFLAQIGYTGSGTKGLVGVLNENQAYPGTTAITLRRPFPAWANIMSYNSYIGATYESMIAKLERRFSKGVTILASYTYGHAIDGGSTNTDTNEPAPQNAHDTAANKGSSDYDVRQRFVLSGLYAIPFGKAHGPLGYLVRNWQLSGVFSAQTGQPFTVTSSTDPTATGATAHPDRIRDGALPSDQRNIHRWFDLSAFATPTCVCFGNSGRDILRGPGFVNLDFGVSRRFQIRERFQVEFRAESFNLMNHPNFGLPGMAIGNQQAGVINSVVNPERQNQLALKFAF